MLPYCDFDEQVYGLDRRRAAAPRSDRPSPGREGRDRRREGAARGVPRLLRGDRRRRARARTSRRTRARFASTWRSSVPRATGKQFGDTPTTSSCSFPDEGFFRAAWEQDPSLVETGVRSRVHVASPTTLIVAAAVDRVRLAAGERRRGRPGDPEARSRALRAVRDRRRTPEQDRQQPQGCRRSVQRHGRLAREAAAPDGTKARGLRRLRQGASGAEPRARAASGAPGSRSWASSSARSTRPRNAESRRSPRRDRDPGVSTASRSPP